MIENDLRETFGRHEQSVPDAMALVPKINDGVRRRRRRRLVVRSASAAAAVIMVLVSLPAIGRAWLASQITSETMMGTDVTGPPSPLAGRPLNFLLLGLDRRRGSDEPVRSDAIILAHVPADRSAIYLITIPRDLRVEVPGHGKAKATEAYSAGGVATTARTLATLTGLTFDGAATVEFTAFKKLAEALGGVYMCVDQRVESDHYDASGRYVSTAHDLGIPGYVYEVGCRRFEPWQALDYLRQRKSLTKGSLDRDRHIAQYLQAVGTQMKASDAMNDVQKARALLGAVGGTLVVDTGNASLSDLFATLRPLLDKDLVAIAMPHGGLRTFDAASYVVADERTKDFFAAVRADEVDRWLRENPDRDSYSDLGGP